MVIERINPTYEDKVDAYQNKYIVTDGIFIKSYQGYYKKYLFRDILWLEASGNYCYIHFAGIAPIVVVKRMSLIEKNLPKSRFIRTHRSFIVNIFAVDGFADSVLIINKHRIPISEPYRSVMHNFMILNRSV